MLKLNLSKLVVSSLSIIFFVFKGGILLGQVDLTFKGYYSHPRIEYSIIEDFTLYTYYPWTYNQRTKVKTFERVQARDMNSGMLLSTNIHAKSLSRYIPAWTKNKSDILVAWESIPYRRSYRHYVLLETIEPETKSPLRQNELLDSLITTYGSKKEALSTIMSEKWVKRNARGVRPVTDWFVVFDIFEKYCLPYYPIEYDFTPETDSTFLFYIRNKKELSVWHYNYPKEKSIKSKRSDWQELVTYSIDTIPFITGSPCLQKSDTTKLLPWGEHHLYESIQDTMFFKGRFKIIQQKGETFSINLHTGYIHHIGEDKITRVGRVEIKAYPKWQFKKRIFIEDRDHEQLIFMAEVERYDKEAAFPDIVVLKSRLEVARLFPGVGVMKD